MAKTKNKYSTCKVINKRGNVIGYLSAKDEEQGIDKQMDLKGYTVVAL